MAKRTKKTGNKNSGGLSLKMRRHIEALGLTQNTYKDWCLKNGFHDSLDKSDDDRALELAFHQREMAHNAAIDKILRDPKRLITMACANQMQPHELSRMKWSSFCLSVQNSGMESGPRRMIVQVRGKHNRLCTRPELEVIRQWANEARLSIDSYVELNE